MSERTLQDQVVMIVGAGRPPAPAIALALADRGAILAVNDMSPVLLDPLEARVRSRSGTIQSYIADATRGMPLRAMIDEIFSDWGHVDVLINNPRIQPRAGLIQMDEWDWQRTVEMNLNGPFLVTQMIARHMQERGHGVVINIVDDNPSALESPEMGAYAASQQGLLAFSQTAAREFMAYNIRVYTCCPEEALLNGDDSGRLLGELVAALCNPAGAPPAGQIFRVGPTSITPQMNVFTKG
ncbi:MAG TPA: SDR family oxidoreductase [Anaerolineaceae bacterium]